MTNKEAMKILEKSGRNSEFKSAWTPEDLRKIIRSVERDILNRAKAFHKNKNNLVRIFDIDFGKRKKDDNKIAEIVKEICNIAGMKFDDGDKPYLSFNHRKIPGKSKVRIKNKCLEKEVKLSEYETIKVYYIHLEGWYTILLPDGSIIKGLHGSNKKNGPNFNAMLIKRNNNYEIKEKRRYKTVLKSYNEKNGKISNTNILKVYKK